MRLNTIFLKFGNGLLFGGHPVYVIRYILLFVYYVNGRKTASYTHCRSALCVCNVSKTSAAVRFRAGFI